MSKLVELLHLTAVLVLFAGFIGVMLGYYQPGKGVVMVLILYGAFSATAFALLERESRKIAYHKKYGR